MDDEKLYAVDQQGWKLQATIFESKYVPFGFCRYHIEIYIESVDWWYTLEDDYHAWLWNEAQDHCKERLSWWAANWRDMPVAQQLL